MPNYALCVDYDGSFFHGWQRQKQFTTVQGNLEKALATVLRSNPHTPLSVAGRTDTGVHALGMICNFKTEEPISNLHKMIVSLNALGGEGLGVRGATEVPQDFHSRFSCDAREYVYQIYNGKYERPHLKNRALWVKYPVDWDRILAEVPHLIGEKDFRSFAKSKSMEGKRAVREILSVQLEQDKEVPEIFKIRIRADGFMHNMVRITVGTLLDIGKGRWESRSIESILEEEDRSQAGITLPPHGLYFVRAYYKNFPQIHALYEPSFLK
ncbi:tRNA pseudouridine(38-40) synthase TruA [Leptospira idonii]|uniref:tRNA pseudouridine synthase A n=1 Tax=Leptospira idonii TaxID=1193500 RepID=A0A4R9M089_9LEPT|nr:tRNA pseudouridine(38-40) synthase TruA [Leptospira idonii]TGN19442.1 tRNA pseudouridine(38-40) synthase TruA [Leptospira idonii]